MSKIIIHIGGHKTGTSSVQRSFHQNRDLLARLGVIYPDIAPFRAHHALATPWIARTRAGTSTMPREGLNLWKRICDQYANSDRTVFISSEALSRTSPDHVIFQQLARILRRFDEVEIVYVMREQATLFQSIYLQYTKNTQMVPTFGDLLGQALNDQEPTGVSLNHFKVLEMILEGFSIDQVTIAEYHMLCHRDAGTVGFMLERCGITRIPAGFALECADANTSADPLSQWIALDLVPGQRLHSDLMEIVRTTLTEAFGPDIQTSLLTRKEVQSLRQLYAPYNRMLLRHLPERPDYLKMPRIQIVPGVLTRAELGRDFWQALARNIAPLGRRS